MKIVGFGIIEWRSIRETSFENDPNAKTEYIIEVYDKDGTDIGTLKFYRKWGDLYKRKKVKVTIETLK